MYLWQEKHVYIYHISYIRYIYIFIYIIFHSPNLGGRCLSLFCSVFFHSVLSALLPTVKGLGKKRGGMEVEFLDRNHEAGESCLHNFLRNKFWSLFVSRLLKKRQPELRKIDLKVGWHSLIFKMRENIFNLGHGSQVFSTLWVCHYQKDLPVFFSSFKHFPNKAIWVWFPTWLIFVVEQQYSKLIGFSLFHGDQAGRSFVSCHGWSEMQILQYRQESFPVSGIFLGGCMWALIPFRRIFEPY